jgi:hypothetical protein
MSLLPVFHSEGSIVKIHELATCMELTAKILRELPDDELPETLEYLLNLVRKSKSQQGDRPREPVEVAPLSQGTINRLATMSPAQIEQFLNTSEEFANLGRLRALAEHLDITASRRQNHAALVNMIVRHFEARQMDNIIRGSRTKDEAPREPESN